MNNLQTFTNSTTITKSSIIHEYSGTSPYHTSIDIKCTGVYNMYEGLVYQIGDEPGDLKYVCVKLSNSYIFKYGHLQSVDVHLYDKIREGELIGSCKKYATFEYLTQVTSKFPMYVNDCKFYKADPTDIIVNDNLPSILSSESTYKHTNDLQTSQTVQEVSW